jgi:CheY-like chemotaxis protein
VIVIVEDQQEIRSLLTDYFTFLKKDVSAYASAEEAINDFPQLKEQSISVIISDYALPGMHGIDFIKHAKEELNPRVCMLISGHLPSEVPENIVVVPKPFRPSVLFQTMNDHLDKLSVGMA